MKKLLIIIATVATLSMIFSCDNKSTTQDSVSVDTVQIDSIDTCFVDTI